MGRYLNIGNAGFAAVLKSEYVDKTGMIEYMNSTLGSAKKLTCVSRPRRFGKSYAAKMLCAYYDRTCDSRELFQGLKISESPDFERYLNKYDVIYLDITWFIATAGGKENIKNIVKNIEKEVIEELAAAYPAAKVSESLPKMISSVVDVTGNKFIIIIDEWDALFREAKEDRDVQEKYIDLLRGLFRSSGPTDLMIEAAYMTGILPIKKYGTHSAMTDFNEFTMLSPGPLKNYVGFTEEEVKRLFEKSELDFEEARRWYDGYEFGENLHIYNPKSVMDALQFERFGNYWTQSETYESLKLYIDMNLDGLQDIIYKLLGGEEISLDVNTFQNDLMSITGKDEILTLLIHLGYLVYHYEEGTVSIPNDEVRKEFLRAVKKSEHAELLEFIRLSEALLEKTWEEDADFVAKRVGEIHNLKVAPTFYNNEQALRSVIQMAYLTCIDEYQEIQELPSGKGYADIVFIPKKRSIKPAMVVELKWDKDADAALKQIKERKYPQVLNGLTDEVLLVGINYKTKTKEHSCAIERQLL